jgi:hypothetical protein
MFCSGRCAPDCREKLTAENSGYLIEATSLLLEGHSAKVQEARREARDQTPPSDTASNTAARDTVLRCKLICAKWR